MEKINKDYFLGLAEIREKLRILYVRGVYDGIDMLRGSDDRFKGNASARAEWEDEWIIKTYQDIVRLLKV